jgi:hypothetical protein
MLIYGTMLVGYNTNITYKGAVYHVQTEDNGIQNPVIVTLLYIKGTIISSRRINYAHIASGPDYREKVRELMKEQHKAMIRELIAGKFTDTGEKPLTGLPPAGIPAETPGTPPAAEKPLTADTENPSSQEPGARDQMSESLDDILLNYILREEK